MAYVYFSGVKLLLSFLLVVPQGLLGGKGNMSGAFRRGSAG